MENTAVHFTPAQRSTSTKSLVLLGYLPFVHSICMPDFVATVLYYFVDIFFFGTMRTFYT